MTILLETILLETIPIILVNSEILHIYYLKHSIRKEIYVAFQNRSNDDYHFLMKELTKEFEGELNCLKIHNLFSYNKVRS